MGNTVGTSAHMDGRDSSARDTTPAPLGHGQKDKRPKGSLQI
ncbi:uncharacterized protein PgNI_04033 [Pyricularia grisea]|uniref:Uncharacterized protein n=1 Tax=Pyricularia grisea TaxID=148305 RepID=A0A6P8BF37_PYRGI|nr:uncharacterized protein PgNI_04033 [Pyricularia grisea]TLD14400.1 hypothetical protein PgNI_04033 [Pyricularia grisea]